MTSQNKNLEHLIKKPTCFKRSFSCICLIITNKRAYLKKTCILETRISNFHKLTAHNKNFRYYKLLQNESYTEIIQHLMKIASIMILKSKLDSMKNLDYCSFENIFINILKF